MNVFELEKELDRGEVFPIYLLYGEEHHLIDEVQKRIRSLCLAPGTQDFNFDRFVGGEISPSRIVDAAKMLPMMGSWRVVQVRSAHCLTTQEVDMIVAYCENPSPNTCLILVADRIGPWKKHRNVLDRKGRVVPFPHPKGNALTRYIVKGAKQMGKEISIEAAEVMEELAGNDLAEIYQELDKIVAYVGKRGSIGIEDIQAVGSSLRSHTVFDLTGAIGMRNCLGALQILNRMLECGEPHLRILHMIVRQIRLIWMAKVMQSQGMRDKDIGRALRIPSFFLPGFMAQLKNFTTEELARGYRRLLETDVALKSGSASKRVLLEHLIICLCR